jgi:hypothetical protein
MAMQSREDIGRVEYLRSRDHAFCPTTSVKTTCKSRCQKTKEIGQVRGSHRVGLSEPRAREASAIESLRIVAGASLW